MKNNIPYSCGQSDLEGLYWTHEVNYAENFGLSRADYL